MDNNKCSSAWIGSICLFLLLPVCLSVYLPVCFLSSPVCLSVSLSVCLSVCLSVSLSVCLSTCLFVFFFQFFFVFLPVCLFHCLPACSCFCLFVCLSVCLSVFPPVCLSVCLCVCLSVCRGLRLCHHHLPSLFLQRKSSGSYVDMESTKFKAVKAFKDPQTQSNTKRAQTTLEGGYMDMTSLRKQQFDKQNGPSAPSEFVQQKKSSSPRQRRTTQSALPNKPDIREFVCIKKSPSTSRRQSGQDYVSMSPLAVPAGESRSYVNFSPGSNSPRCGSPNLMSTSQREESNRCYVNYSPGEIFANRNAQLDSLSPQIPLNGSVESSSYEDMRSYVNFNPGNNIEQKATTSDFRKHSFESVLSEKPREYENVDFNGIAKSKSAVDVPEYVNFSPGKPFGSSHNDSSSANGDTDASLEEALDYVGFSPGKVLDENEWWRRSPRSNRRESEPARLQPPKYGGNTSLGSTREDEEITQLNYVMLDLNKTENSSESPSRERRRPPKIDLSSCLQASPGPKSAPVRSIYAEVDFTKSDGIRQARQEVREPTNTAV